MSEKLTAEINQLKTALDRLKEALSSEPTQLNKDATIQRFEFTFELLWKMLKTYIEESGLEANSPKDTFRVAADLEIISDPTPYFKFLQARNLSTHTYSQDQANEIYENIKSFPLAIESILQKTKGF